jgi:hypothetical protein
LGVSDVGGDTIKVDRSFSGIDMFARKIRLIDLNIRLGYEIQGDNEFLLGFVGWGWSFRSSHTKVVSS